MLRIAIECFFICLRNNYNYDQRLVFSFKSGDLPNKEFRINSDGDLVLDKALDFEIQTLFTFSVIVTDGVDNDVRGVDPGGFPTIVLYDKRKKKGVEYSASRN